MSTVQIVAGFSPTNRWLLYASVMLAPAQFLSGINSNCPSNIGFLAYNWYTQIQWYWAIQAKQLHALSMLTMHFNMIYAITYLGGITSGNIVMGLILGLGTAGVLILNTVAAWTSWAMDQPDGFGIYQFFFFGWRTLNPNWHTFFLLWQITDSMLALSCVLLAIIGAVTASTEEIDNEASWLRSWTCQLMHRIQDAKYPAILVGSALMLLLGWPLILWVELIVARNNIESATDMVAVWLFVAQVATMIVPSP